MSQNARRAELRALERGRRLGAAVKGLEELVKECEEVEPGSGTVVGPWGILIEQKCGRLHLRWWPCCVRCAWRRGR